MIFLHWTMLLPAWLVRVGTWFRVLEHQLFRWPCASTPPVLEADRWYRCGACGHPGRKWLDA